MTHWKPKHLEWENCGDTDRTTINSEIAILFDDDVYYKVATRKADERAIAIIGYGPVPVASRGGYDSKQAAKDACQAHANKRVAASIEVEEFWRPMAQCPKVLGQYYLAINAKSRTMLVVRWDDYYGEWNSADKQPRYDDDFTHFAEIPALGEAFIQNGFAGERK